MATTQDYIKQLKKDKENLVSMLNNMGVEASNDETFTSLTPKVEKVVTEPILQDKTVTIIENGTQTITADEGYDGLNNVEVVTEVASSGGEKPTKGLVIDEYDENGYVTKISLLGFTEIPTQATGNSSTGLLTTNLKEVYMDDNPTVLKTNAFSYCKKLETVRLSPNITNFEGAAFSGCSSLVLNTLPDSVINIYNAFMNCTSLVQMSIKNIQTIYGSGTTSSCFHYCTSLKAVWLGSSLTGLDRYTFNNCTALKKLFIDLPRATVESFAGYIYIFSNNKATLMEIVCNDDEGFMTKEEFDAIDWSTVE